MKLNRNLNTWLLLFALAVMVNRVLTPFSVPALVVHEDGYIEICAWHGGTSRVLLDAEGNQVESEQPFSYCPECTSPTAASLPDLDLASDLPPPTQRPPEFQLHQHLAVFTTRPPPSRAPPCASVLIG
ncbi:hypothetical protein SAMN05660443_1856 [Marinospirillum celere]|uniref:DUF2946 domain-containing protein n=1 Tax=Marinospirillum celere TaxID=1122252 RepID=A0A1I1H7I8_9GAMM|nr:hypothetical protein [Marinospirillum celere]SFC19977.1 hypothetical protein SAMN05660443_1856 [Marinospirillum celere]